MLGDVPGPGVPATGASVPGAPIPVPAVPDRPARLAPYGLRCEHRTEPMGLGAPAPLLSWRLASRQAGDDPVAYQVDVTDLTRPGTSVWSTGRVEDAASVGVRYAGPALRPRTRYGWHVTVWAQDGTRGSAESWFETGHDTWTASWITHDPSRVEPVDPPTRGEQALDDHGLLACPRLRHAFSAPVPARARLYVSARGLYEARLNGERVGDAELAPGWTDYRSRIQYQVYDVTALVRDGENVLAATVADGWWSGFVGFAPRRAGQHYGPFPEFVAELHLSYDDGSTRVVATGPAWRTARGPIRYADLLKGECHDARLETPGWDRPGFDDSAWLPATVAGDDHSSLVASRDEPVRAFERLAPRSVTRLAPGVHLVDFGQNIAGRVRLAVPALPEGRRVSVRHGETLEGPTPHGDPRIGDRLHIANLRTADATDVFISAGRAEVFEPRFTYHGFRYAEVTGLDELGDVHAVVLHSDIPWAGRFACSDPDITRLHANIGWGQRGNFVSVPTDCPQRDERLGWLADAQVFLPTACLNADVAAFFAKWLDDVSDAQSPEGGFSNVAPLLTGVADEGAPGWADAGVLVPWHLYRVYGDPAFLDVEAMARWVGFVHRNNPDLIWRHRVGPHFADWLSPGPPTPRPLIGTAYFQRSAALTARAARVVGRDGDADHLDALAAGIRQAFVKEFVDAGGRVAGDTQTGYLLALAFDLLPEEAVAPAADRLAELVAASGLQTGFLGVSLLCPVLSAHGHDDLAHALLGRTGPPSWLHQVRSGATTVWERWDGVGAPSMNSFNHYALGSVGEWLYSGVAGIGQAPTSTAYRELVVRPSPGDLDWAEASYESVRGTVGVRWERSPEGFRLDATIPPGATATVHLPGGTTRRVTSGDHSFTLVRGETA
ncbi:alpha-L-rhamnosidase [Planotetraspora mira]|uniref:alpha-L-rhamnosidase n=1 Tax=Planotetraspora mira TaxID=58121 RepID=A0A8J3TNL7_9ACTN|nr:alpha-L-rhamnosidase [Planotetraspora mira]GII29216.1 alpha-L-rhamnosidase [Planotetraspora mira]